MNRAGINRAGKILVILVLAVLLMFSTVTAYAETIRDTDVTVAGSGNTLVYLDGEFKYVSKDTILNRINEIRYEAWAEGLVSTYIPIQWSSDLEWIAQTRAAEASMYASHYRLFEIEEMMPSYFIRISKSAIANVKLITSLRKELTGNGEIEFKSCDKKVYFSRAYYKLLRDKIEEIRL